MRQTRGAINFLKASYLSILKNAFLAMCLASCVSLGANAANLDVNEENFNDILNDENYFGYQPDDSDGSYSTIHATTGSDESNLSISLGSSDKAFNLKDVQLPDFVERQDGLWAFGAIDVSDAKGATSINLGKSSLSIVSGSNIDGTKNGPSNPYVENNYAAIIGSYAEVDDRITDHFNFTINSATVNVEQGAKLNGMQLAGAIFNQYSEDVSGQYGYSVSGTLTGNVNIAGDLTNTPYIVGAETAGDRLEVSDNNYITTIGNVNIAKGATVSGIPNNSEEADTYIVGAKNEMQGAAIGNVTIAGKVTNMSVTSAFLNNGMNATKDTAINASLSLTEDGVIEITDAFLDGNEEGYTPMIGAAEGMNVDNVTANTILNGQLKFGADSNIAIVAAKTEGDFKSIDSKLTIAQNEANNVASTNMSNSEFGITNVKVYDTSSESANSSIKANATIAGFTGKDKTYTFNNVLIEGSSTNYAGNIVSNVTVAENAYLETLNAVNTVGGGKLKGANITENITVSDKAHIKNINLIGDEILSNVEKLTASVSLIGEAIIDNLNLSSQTVKTLADNPDALDFTLNVAGNVTLGTLDDDLKLSNLNLDARSSSADKAVLTVSDGNLDLKGTTVTANMGSLTEDRQLISGTATLDQNSKLVQKTQFFERTTTLSTSDGQDKDISLNNLSVSKDGDFAVEDSNGDKTTLTDYAKENNLNRNTSTSHTSSTKTLSETVLGTVALINQAQEFIANTAMDAAHKSAINGQGNWSSFGAITGGYVRYETGSHVDLTSVNGVVGLAKNFKLNNGNFTTSLFMDLGTGSSDVSVDSSSADGDNKYIGGGLAARYALNNGLYFDASLRLGQSSTEFEGRYAGQDNVTYDTDSMYWGAHAGAGFIYGLNDNLKLDSYVRYTYSYLEDDTEALNDVDKSKFEADDVTTHGVRVGTKLNMDFNKVVSGYAGLAYQHVFDGDIKSSIAGASIDTASLEGNAGILDLGVTINPQDTNFKINLGLSGYAGDISGVTGNLMAAYAF